MSICNIIEYTDIYIGNITFSSVGSISVQTGYVRNRNTLNKMACFFSSPGYKGIAGQTIRGRCLSFTQGTESLFVSPKCRISRDLLRKSGYKIVRDPDKADFIVVPALPEKEYFYYYDVLNYNPYNNCLYLYTVNRNERVRRSMNTFNDDDFQKIKEYFGNSRQWFQDKIYDTGICQLLPIINEYKTILLDGTQNYILEYNVVKDVPININVETLEMWRYFDDYNVLAKAICNSDWVKYPATLKVFLYYEKPDIYNFGGSNMALVLDKIGFDKRWGISIDTMLSDMVISPEDWNLLQEWCMKAMHLSSEGGYANKQDVNTHYLKLVKSAFVVRPLKLSIPMLYENISKMLQ